MAVERVDVTIFGATGYTGKCVVEEFVKFNESEKLSWAVAGRNEEKLHQVLNWASLRTGRDVTEIRIIVADCNDEQSLDAMTKQTRAVINCCGPYSFFGESVVKACIQNGTHHVDVSGEPEFMERMQIDYHQRSEQKGVYIISACGFESVANDLGVIYLEKNFRGVVNSVESYVECVSDVWEPGVNITTWECLVNGIATMDKLKPIRQKLHSTMDKPNLEPRLNARSIVHRSPVFDNKPCVWFFGPDVSVVQRTQQSLYKLYKQRPIQFQAYFITQPILLILGMMIVAFFLFTFGKCSVGRKLMLRYPGLFTFGVVTKNGPSEKARLSSFATFRFIGKGWSKEVAEKYESQESINKPTDSRMVTEMSFPDIGYGFTAKAVILGAVTILKEYERMPLKGGVLTPGAAFAKTNFLEKLAEQEGVSLKVL